MKIAYHSLGCKVNNYESNAIVEMFLNAGYELVKFDELADIYLINTCCVTNISEKKSRQFISRAAKKNAGLVVVMGCYSQKNASDIKNIKGVNIVIGTKNRSEILSLVQNYQKDLLKVDQSDIWEFEDLIVTHFNQTRAYIKIQDGCDSFCSYCIIPYVRGRSRSKNYQLCIDEAKKLALNGYQEIVLTGIHTGKYAYQEYHLTDVIKGILNETAVERIRISSIEIMEVTDELIALIRSDKRLCRHLHLPLQSGSNDTLKRMNRNYDVKMFLDKLTQIRLSIPDIAITTDLIVGFPLESENEFLETIETIKQAQFSFIHLFPYAKKNLTESALLKEVDGNIVKKRIEILNAINLKIANDYISKFKNQIFEVIVEEKSKKGFMGHTSNYLHVEFSGENIKIGEKCNVLIENAIFPLCKGKGV